MHKEGSQGYRIEVPEEFKSVFSHFYMAENTGHAPVTKTLLPSYQTMIIFGFGSKAWLTSQGNARIKIDKSVVLGPIKKSFDYTLPPGSEILVGNFKDDAFYRFFGKVMIESLQPMNPDNLLKKDCFAQLWYAVEKLPTPADKVELILQFCKPYLRPCNGTSTLIANFKDEALNPVKAIAKQTNQSERSVQMNYKTRFGYSAREVNRYHRFIQAIELIKILLTTAKTVDWFEVIDQCGYYDQSQLIHDFKYYIHLSPKQFLKFQQDICR